MRENKESVVLFVCEHGSAKSVVAAAHFNKPAHEMNLNIRALSRGTDPDEEILPNVLQGLTAEGLMPGEAKPKLLSRDDVAGVARVVTFCDLPKDIAAKVPTESWGMYRPSARIITRHAMK